MHIVELSIEQFNDFITHQPMRNYCQTIDYAILMGQQGYDYELIGYIEHDRVYAASLMLIKKIGYKCYFSYAPKGFLIDYTDANLVKNFIKDIREYYLKKDFVFIKINPEIAIGEVNLKNFNTIYNNNYHINKLLLNNGFTKLKSELKIDNLFPTFTGIIPLKKFDINYVNKNTRNKIKKSLRKGLYLEKSGVENIKTLEKFAEQKKDFYFNDLYNIYSKHDNADLFLINIDSEKYLINSQNAYVLESTKNQIFNQKMIENPSNQNINKKMNSDRALLVYKNDITEASKLFSKNESLCIGAALVVKDGVRIHLLAGGFDNTYKRFMPSYFLYYSILNYYKKEFIYADLNGIDSNFDKNSENYKLNRFKFGFNPKVYELIGDMDLVLDELNYNLLLKSNLLQKEFNKK